jgi:hypothetical protein
MLDYRQTEDRHWMIGSQSRAIVAAIAVSGTLDILSAFAFNGIKGVGPGPVLRYVASGPFGDSMRDGGLGAAAIGLGVHYALMAIMVLVFFLVAVRIALVRRQWILSGTLYGILLYLIMYWIVVPARFGAMPKTDLWSVGNALFSHIVCVGLPMAFIASRTIGRSESSAEPQLGLETASPGSL